MTILSLNFLFKGLISRITFMLVIICFCGFNV
jgi:hypothetical protein